VKKSRSFYAWYLAFTAIVGIIAFVSGMAVSLNLESEDTLNLAARLVQLVPGVMQIESGKDIPAATDLKPLATFWEVRDKIRRYYVKPIESEDDIALTYGAIRGMLAALEDPYSRFMTPEQYREFQEQTQGEFEGIGAELTQRKGEDGGLSYQPMDEKRLKQALEQVASGQLDVEAALPRVRELFGGTGEVVVMSVLPEGPAADTDLRAGDVILKVNGQSLAGMWLTDVVDMIKGPEGTAVALTLGREGMDEPVELTIVRARVDMPVLEYEMRDGDIGYIWLRSFNRQAYSRLQDAIQDLVDQGMKGLIFDLSANGGGLLPMAVSVSGLFVSGEPVVYVQERGQEPEPYEPRSEALVPPELPIVVLIAPDSASASEIVAGCLQDLGRATIVGHNSFGKSKVQTVVELNDGSAMALTTALYLTPHKRDLSEEDEEGRRGVTPDVRFPEPDPDNPPTSAEWDKWHKEMVKRAHEVVAEKVAATNLEG